ncbi:uncharacterized protein LOC129191284 [Dunckerocampus dactyliophorus]|uniref:uncharacterized protein LOC129191284 n=1 Tax=Dunckerocampus dactyliophorus TaxID=161453 RepID=UPI002406F902|nr:uncharacterized protein LOC129191284 [Dunckerocampus dactyliophorus]
MDARRRRRRRERRARERAMAPRKCFFGCEGKLILFSLPKEASIRQKWLKLLIPEQQEIHMLICQRHFTRDRFVNMGQYEAGLSAKLLLKSDAFPTLLGRVEESKELASTSQQILPRPKHRHVGCQTEPVSTATCETQFNPHMVSVGTKMLLYPATKSVATQLSYSTLRQHVRSKGTQATVSVQNVGTETRQLDAGFQFSSTQVRGFAPLQGARPAKRPRLEFEESKSKDEEEETIVPHDSTYEPSDFITEPSEISGKESRTDYNDAKYIVFESCLVELFQTCPVCKRDCQVQPRRLGTYVAYTQLCLNCQYTRKWQSQPLRGNTPAGNLQMSAAIYFTGGSFIQVDKIFKAMNVQMYNYDTFRRHARNLLEPAINHKWRKDQQTLFHILKQESSIAVSGAMRADTPGHSVKFGCYTLMHLDSNNIMDIQLVQSNEVSGTVHMEKEGLKRGLDHLEKNNVKVDYIVTDRHTQVQTFLSERGITQYYDVWHLEKALSKKLQALAKNKDCAVLQRWLPAIKNHMYWTATSSKSGPEKAAKWKSIINHIQDVHSHDDPLYPKCLHADQLSTDSSKWFQPCTLPLHKVEKLLVNKRILRDVEKLSEHHQTSSLESFYRVILHFAPKNVVFSYIGMLCRLYLAAMHFTENAQLERSKTLEGKAVYKVTFPKYKKGQATAKPVKTKPTFRYVRDLMRLVFEEVLEDPTKYTEELKEIPIPDEVCAQFERPSKEEVIATHVSRFSRGADSGSHRSDQRDQETPGISGTQHTTG